MTMGIGALRRREALVKEREAELEAEAKAKADAIARETERLNAEAKAKAEAAERELAVKAIAEAGDMPKRAPVTETPAHPAPSRKR